MPIGVTSVNLVLSCTTRAPRAGDRPKFGLVIVVLTAEKLVELKALNKSPHLQAHATGNDDGFRERKIEVPEREAARRFFPGCRDGPMRRWLE